VAPPSPTSLTGRVADAAFEVLLPEGRAAAQASALIVWREGRILTQEALVGRLAAMGSPLGGPGPSYPLELSLMKHGDKAVFVHWSYVSGKTARGRVCRVDPASREAIWPTAATSPELSFATDEIIHPAIGIRVQRLREDRPTVPVKILRLKRVWDIALDTSAQLHPECTMCRCNDSLEPVHSCPLCQCQWHESCCIGLSGFAAHDEECWQPLQPPGNWIPPLITDLVCRLCNDWCRRPCAT